MTPMRINETIVVEGRDDTAAINRAVEALTIETHGFGISSETWQLIQKAYDTTGIIVFTDPDFAGEQIRKRIMARFPDASQAYLDRIEASASGDVGIENGSPEAIREALSKCKVSSRTGTGLEPLAQSDSAISPQHPPFTREDLLDAGMWGGPNAADRRRQAGKILGIGYGNCNHFLRKLNQFHISKEEFYEAIHHISHP
jgi:ribonuclease M5